MTVACQERILVIEDEEDLALILQFRLKSAGYEVQIEPLGAGGLRAAATQRPALVILDLRLPDLDGHEVCRALRDRYSHTDLPILMFTVMDDPSEDIHSFAAGADAYLPKSTEPSQLLDTVERLLRGEEIPVGPRF